VADTIERVNRFQPLALVAAIATTAACADESATAGTQGGPGGAGPSSGTSQGGATSSSTTTSSGAGGGGDDIPGGGTVLFEEPFDDAMFDQRGWYDGPMGTITTAEHATGSPSAFECGFAPGATSCSGGKPARHKFTDSDTVYLAFWLKFSANWVGSGLPYHPHMFHFLTNLDSDFVGPASTFLTTYTEVVEGRAMLALQDSTNVDDNCILRNDDSFVGCNGDFASYVFTEDRSACSCNGLVGEVDGRDCFDTGNGWYSSRSWRSPMVAFGDTAPFDKNAWHRVEIYFALNGIQNGIGAPDGKIRWVQDGQTLVSSDQILFRTGSHATMMFNQFAMLPYIGDGSPLDQQFWVDDLVVATARP
jgi:hypothetical protein